MSDSVWNCGRSLVLWVPGISGSIGNRILGYYFPEREYNLLNPKRTRKRPKFQPCPPPHPSSGDSGASSGHTSGTPTPCCPAGTPGGSSASARCSGSGRRGCRRPRPRCTPRWSPTPGWPGTRYSGPWCGYGRWHSCPPRCPQAQRATAFHFFTSKRFLSALEVLGAAASSSIVSTSIEAILWTQWRLVWVLKERTRAESVVLHAWIRNTIYSREMGY